MTRPRATGFVLVLVIAVIALTGTALLVLTIATNTMIFESRRMYLDACSRNLSASGLAWAGRNVPQIDPKRLAKGKKLPTDAMEIPGGELKVATGKTDGKRVEVRISTVCSSGRHTVRRDLSCAVAAAR
jgi:hypothetical protein